MSMNVTTNLSMNDRRPAPDPAVPVAVNRRDTRRRFEQWVRNTGCEANLVSAVHNIKMGKVARVENPNAPREGQSVFALARGRTFEAGLVKDGGARLIEALQRHDVFASTTPGFLDLRTTANGGALADLDTAIARTEAFLLDLSRHTSRDGDTSRDGETSRFEGVVSSATVRIPKGVMLPEATLIIDAITVTWLEGRPVINVGEIKTYSDRGGHTSRGDLAVARAQMGLYVHALQLVAETLGIHDRIVIADRGFLVLTFPGSNVPSVRIGEDLRYQVERARRGFDLLEKSAAALPELFDDDRDDENSDDEDSDDEPSDDNDRRGGHHDDHHLVDVVLQAPTAFGDQCLSFCERADACFERALNDGDGAVLGDDVARFLNGLSLHRVDELMGGDQPRSEAEHDFLRRMQSPLDAVQALDTRSREIPR